MRKLKFSLCIVILTAVMPFVSTAMAQTVDIAVPDAGFEDHPLSTQGDYIYIGDASYTGAWKDDNGSDSGAYVDYRYWLGDGDLPARSGDLKAYSSDAETLDSIYQILDETFIEGATYTLSVWVGNAWPEQGYADGWGLYFTGEDYSIHLAEAHGLALEGDWEQISLDYTATADDAGKRIGIKMSGEEGESYVAFDDVTLSYENPVVASNPRPTDGQTDVPWDTVLRWTPGLMTAPTDGHVVYIGDNYDDVHDASGGTPQTVASYTPVQKLDFGKTYHWRVDQVGSDQTVYHGLVWSFTVEPASYPITAGEGGGAEIVVPDAGFDDHALDTGGYVYFSDAAYAGPWQSQAVDQSWIDNGYYAADGDLPALSGNNKAYGNESSEDFIYQILDETFIEGETYTLSVWTGSAWAGYADGWWLYMTGEDYQDNLAATSGRTPVGAWERVSLSYTATADDAGKKIGIKMKGDPYVTFEDVTLSYGNPASVEVRASSQDATQVLANAINGSGLNDNDEHSTWQEDMWLTVATDLTPWIQFDFMKSEKLDKVRVWNHNTPSESVLGFGIREALIEYSDEGETWHELGVVEIAQAPGLDDYPGVDVPLDGIIARHVKMSVVRNWSQMGLPQTGLSEVRLYAIPVKAREPMPADGSMTDGVDVFLQWRSGREAVSHDVFFSTDRQAVIDGTALIDTVDSPSLALGTLELGDTFYWKIDEVNEQGTPPVHEGDLWTFRTPDQIMIDDFEMYSDKQGERIYEYWVDGFDDPGENGAVVGNGDDAETDEVHEGRQSMPLAYNNVNAPKSEAVRSFDPPLDLTAGNPESFELYFKGIPYEFNGYYSIDGTNWNLMSWSPRYVVMSADALIGMAVTSHDAAQVTTATFSSVSTTGNVTGSWTQADIGGTHPNEDFAEIGGTFTIKASGADIWNAADEFRYVYKQLAGAGSITAKAESLEHVHDWTKGGVMIRDNADPASSFAMVAATPVGTQGVRYQARLEGAVNATSDSTVLDGSQELMDPPTWIRMERKVANGAAPIYVTLTDRSGKSATLETEAVDATTIDAWTKLSAAPADLNVNLSQIESITIGIAGGNVEGKVFIDTIRTHRPDAGSVE